MSVCRAGLLLLVLLTSGCDTPEAGSTAPFIVPLVPSPLWDGGFAVGRRDEIWTDHARDRPLPVTVWYPTAAVDSVTEALYPDATLSILHRTELTRRLGPAGASGLTAMRSRADRDATIAPWDERFPVLLFAPGAGWLPQDYSALLEGVASHGFVVIAVAAPGASGTVRLPDGTIVHPELPDDDTVERLAVDLAFLHSQLFALDEAPQSPFHHRLALGSVGVFGHGVGGSAAVFAAARDTTMTAVANLDGNLLHRFRGALVGQPMLYVTTEPSEMSRVPMDRWSEDRGERRRDEQWLDWSEGSRQPRRVRLAMMHQWNFLDAALVAPRTVGAARRSGRFGAIDGARGIGIAIDVTSQFFRESFALSRTGFDEVRALYPEVAISR